MTKQERHEVYKKALEVLPKYEKYQCGLCLVLEDTLTELDNTFNPFQYSGYLATLRALPEFYSKKPKGVKKNSYWWDRYHDRWEIRKKVLQECIKETE